VQLRKLDVKLLEAMDSIAKYFSEEKDPLFQRGAKKKESSFVSSLIRETEFDDQKIASLAGVSLDFIEKVRSEINKAK
jgi:hypothetical protein